MKANKQNIEYILKSLYEMSLDVDWNESKAQELIMEAGELWEDYQKGKVLILDSQY